MTLTNFTQAGTGPRGFQGPCEVGGNPAHAAFDLSDPLQPRVIVRFDTTPGAQLPPLALQIHEITIGDTAVPVGAVDLPDGSGSLQGVVGRELVEALAGPGVGPRPEGAADAAREDAAAAARQRTESPFDSLVRQYQEARGKLAAAGTHKRQLTRSRQEAQLALDEATEDLAGIEQEMAPLQSAVETAKQALRDAIEAD